MHASLRRKTNLLMLEVWFVAALAISFFARPIPWLLLASGALLGAIAGALQLRAMRSSSGAFLASTSMQEVRRAMTASGGGRAYIYVFWGSAVLLVVLAWSLLGPRFPLGWAASYATFAFTRELVTFRGIIELESLSARASRGNDPTGSRMI